MNQALIQMEIIEAIRDDFIVTRGWFKEGDRQFQKYKRKIGQIYWLRSMSGKYEGPYILDAQTDGNAFKEYLDHKMVFIPKHVLETKIKTLKEEVAGI